MADHFEQRKIVGIVEEQTSGTFYDNFAVGDCNLAAFIDSIEYSAESETYERNVATPTYSEDVDIIARESGTIRARAEVRGSGVVSTTVPSWAPWIEACGTVRAALEEFTFDEGTSVDLTRWRPGITITQAVTAATGVLVDVDLATSKVLIHTRTGAAGAANNWTGTSSAGAFTIAHPGAVAPTAAGLVWYFRSDQEIFSQGTLSMPLNPAPAETVTVGTITYTWIAAPAAPYDVDIGAAVADSQANLVAAINGSGTDGVEYFAGTLQNPDVKIDDFAANDAILTARVGGAVGDAIVTTETMVGVGNEFNGTGTLGATTAGRAYHYSIAEFLPFSSLGRSTRHAIKGAVGECEISADNIGAPMMFDFNMKGADGGELEVVTPTPIAYESNATPLFRGINYHISGDALATQAQCKINSFRFRFGNEIESDEYATAAAPGIVKYDIVNRKPNGEHNPRLLEPSVKSFFDDYTNAQTGRLVMDNGSAVEGNIIKMIFHKVQYQSYGHENIRRKVHAKLTFGAKSNEITVGDNEWYLIKR